MTDIGRQRSIVILDDDWCHPDCRAPLTQIDALYRRPAAGHRLGLTADGPGDLDVTIHVHFSMEFRHGFPDQCGLVCIELPLPECGPRQAKGMGVQIGHNRVRNPFGESKPATARAQLTSHQTGPVEFRHWHTRRDRRLNRGLHDAHPWRRDRIHPVAPEFPDIDLARGRQPDMHRDQHQLRRQEGQEVMSQPHAVHPKYPANRSTKLSR